ncbi:hypothetical protein [Listeria booriae]|uniref:Uncharacterized protein n=1 Tax=Listeria booriae TaxID=1552123 RepID=A0A7X0YJR5_9LIST|nr:hypothetical protein [Listeria booriae]MBC2115724.1 hypothetical protein [Listeria booriae]
MKRLKLYFFGDDEPFDISDYITMIALGSAVMFALLLGITVLVMNHG